MVLFARKRIATPAPRPSLLGALTMSKSKGRAPDPEAQVELVCQTVQKLDEVRELVNSLPEIPGGDRQALLAQLASTVDSLRCLYFLDAIY
jgi:hypothetical protein